MRMKLPEPKTTGIVSVEEALNKRRSTREYAEAGLTLSEAAQLLWSAYGISSSEGFRTAPVVTRPSPSSAAPSAMALYPLEFYLSATLVEGLPPGFYQYVPTSHELKKLGDESKRKEL